MPRLDHIRQFYQDGGYIKPAKRNPAEAVARVRGAKSGEIPRLKMDVAGSVAEQVRRQGLLPLLRFSKNFIGNLPKQQQAALEKVGQHARTTGKESLIYGRLPGEDPVTGSVSRSVTKPKILGEKDSVSLPPSYFKFLRDTQDAPGQLWTAHAHPGPRSSAVPSDIMGDLGVAMNRGQGSLMFDQEMKPTPGAWQNMLITSPASNTAVKLDPMNQMFSGPNARLTRPLDLVGDPKLKELLSGDSLYGATRDDTQRRLLALKDWSGAHGIDIPSLRDWSSTRSSSPSAPAKAAWMPFQQAQSARMYDALGHYGVGAEMDWKTPFANTDVTQREALPSFLNYWRRFHERPSDADYGLSEAIPERQLNLGLAGGGRIGFANGGSELAKRVGPGLLRTLGRYADPASQKISDWAWKPLKEVIQSIPGGLPGEVPEHVLEYGDFMRRMRAKGEAGGLDPRDALKAYTTTLSSIQRQARDRGLFPGMKFSSPEQMIRPEGAFSDWLGSKPGQRYLNRGAKGEVDEAAIKDMADRLNSFGLMPTLMDRMRDAPELINTLAPSGWSGMMHELPGIDAAKKGFMGSMIGQGDRPTFDARQIALHVPPHENPRNVQNMIRRGQGQGGEEAVARLAARQNAYNMFLPPEYQPDYQHLVHHTIWDAANQTKTPHADIMDMMENRARGGRIGFQSTGWVKPVGSKILQRAKLYAGPLLEKWAADTGHSVESLVEGLRSKQAGVKGATETVRGVSDRMDPSIFSGLNVRMRDAPPVFRPTIDPQDMRGGFVVGGMSDLSAAGPTLEGLGGTRFRKPVWLQGGSDFPAYNPDLWAGDPGALQGLIGSLKRAGWQEGMPAYFTNKTMLPQAVDQTHMAMDAATQMLRDAGLSRREAKTFNDAVRQQTVSRNPTKEDPRPTVPAMEDFPGINSANLDEYLADTPMARRSALLKVMDKKAMNDIGVPSASWIRAAMTDPRLAKVPQGTVGRTIGQIDMDNPIITDPLMAHGSYGANLAGKFLGGFDRPVPGSMLFRDWHAGKGFDPTNMSAQNMRSFMVSPAVQKIDDQFLDQFMPQFERLQRGWRQGGRATQRDYELYHPTMWSEPEGFAEGGKVAFPVQSRRRDYELYHPSQWQDDWV